MTCMCACIGPLNAIPFLWVRVRANVRCPPCACWPQVERLTADLASRKRAASGDREALAQAQADTAASQRKERVLATKTMVLSRRLRWGGRRFFSGHAGPGQEVPPPPSRRLPPPPPEPLLLQPHAVVDLRHTLVPPWPGT